MVERPLARTDCQCQRRGLVPRTTTRKHVHSALIEYIARQQRHGRTPAIVQDADRRFRTNHPLDDCRRRRPQVASLRPHPGASNSRRRRRETPKTRRSSMRTRR
jgi:hypothetical protein